MIATVVTQTGHKSLDKNVLWKYNCENLHSLGIHKISIPQKLVCIWYLNSKEGTQQQRSFSSPVQGHAVSYSRSACVISESLQLVTVSAVFLWSDSSKTCHSVNACSTSSAAVWLLHGWWWMMYCLFHYHTIWLYHLNSDGYIAVWYSNHLLVVFNPWSTYVSMYCILLMLYIPP